MFKSKSELDKYVKRLQRNDPTLKTIYLSNKHIGDAGARRLAGALKGNGYIQRLFLGDNSIGDEGAKALAEALKENGSLRELNLGDNSIGDEGAKALAGALKGSGSLKVLYLYWNSIGDEGAMALADALKGNGSIQELNLDRNSIGDEGAKALAGALKGNRSLQKLCLGSNSIGVEGAKALAGALKGNGSIQRLDLDRNSIGNEGAEVLAEALLSNHTLTRLELDDNNNITNENILQKISHLLEMNKLGPEEAARRKEAEYGAIAVAPSQNSSPFFVKLVEEDSRNIIFKIAELVPLIDDVHQLKIFYTVVATCLRTDSVSESDAAAYVKSALEGSSKLCSSEDAIVLFKLILEKASEDDFIPRADFHRYDNRAEVTRMEHAPFIVSMREAIRANTARIEGLEANVEAVNNSINKIKKGLRRKQKVEATVGFFSAVVNVVTMGVGGSLLAAAEKTLGSIVDFGDVVHMKRVVTDSGDSELMEQFQLGVDIGSGRIADDRLEQAIKEDNVLVVLSAAAVMVQQSPQNDGIPLHARVTLHSLSARPDLNGRRGVVKGAIGENGRQMVLIDGMTTEVSLKVTNLTVIVDDEDIEGGDDGGGNDKSALDMFSDAKLNEEEEDDLPVHAAIKYGDKECLEEALAESAVDVNQVDSNGRTAMDLAALTGQIELLELIKSGGGKFKYKNPPRMRLIAKKREEHKDKYLELVKEHA